MPLIDFTGKKWGVIANGNSAKCRTPNAVTISLSESGTAEKKNLIIECAGEEAYDAAIYNAKTNTIDVGDYEIRLLIEFKPKGLNSKSSNSIAGSWTAEDQGPWPGDE